VIGLVTATAAGRAMAGRLAAAWPGECTVHSGPVADQLHRAWTESEALVCFLATGATVRLLAPLLSDKHTDPGVVCVDEAGTHAVALLGGHGGGANDLAVRVAGVLGGHPVLTTATDSAGHSPLDRFGADLGFRLADPAPVARVTRALLDGEPVRIDSDLTWPLPALSTVDDWAGSCVAPDAAEPARSEGRLTLTVSDRTDARGDLVYRPPSLVLGVGASRGVGVDELRTLVAHGLAEAGLAVESVRALATADVKAAEPGIVALAAENGWPLLTFPARELAAQTVPNPSETVRAAVGTPSVAEAAALLGARRYGRGADLVLPKQSSAMGTVAAARLVPRGRLTIVGLGPGAADLRTPRATEALRRAAYVVGLDQYVDQIRHLLRPGTTVVESGLGAEEERAGTAVRLATQGNAVALIGSGDAGVYAMASPALQLAGADVDVAAVPGVTAALAAAALLGAPLGHDHAYLSLSDLHTPWPVIVSRLHACAQADLVLCLYNPRSAKRTAQFEEAVSILAGYRDPETPVGIVRDASRPGERVILTTLDRLRKEEVDMRSVVLVGSSRTTVRDGRMVTPREYRWLS
jgi:cobalt-precorrin 5A hydrolase / cobalt-factor III methyltransferase / precorrin-3B C17-methyltransferase